MPAMARCTLSRALDAPQFWATVYDQLTTDFVETAAMKESLGRLTLKSLIVQCKADGVDVATIERCMDSHSDPIPDLCKACIDERITSRARQCPSCNDKFAATEVAKIWLTE